MVVVDSDVDDDNVVVGDGSFCGNDCWQRIRGLRTPIAVVEAVVVVVVVMKSKSAISAARLIHQHRIRRRSSTFQLINLYRPLVPRPRPRR